MLELDQWRVAGSRELIVIQMVAQGLPCETPCEKMFLHAFAGFRALFESLTHCVENATKPLQRTHVANTRCFGLDI